MATIEQIAMAILQDDSLLARTLAQEFLCSESALAEINQPETPDPEVLALTASLLELFALRTHQSAPAWTQQIGPVEEPIYLLKAAARMRRLRDLCHDAGPEPLRRRRLYAPPDYLAFA
jgi:hypothetical protein